MRRKIAYCFFATTFVFLLIEVVSFFAICLLDHPRISYFANYEAMLQSNLPSRDRWFGVRISHPYFGFVRELTDPVTNNMGFMDHHDFPYLKRPNEYVVGIFGGSVAMLFGANEASKKIIAESLKKKFPSLKDKEIVVLNFGVGGSKQPQSFFIFSYFEKYIDLAINIDGFNEISVTVGPGFPDDYPLDSRYYFRNNARDLAIFGRLELARSFIRRVARVPNSFFPLRFSQAYYLFTSQLYGVTTRWAGDITKSLRDTPKASPGETTTLSVSKRVAIWKRYTSMEASLGQTMGIANLFFIQPNQYVVGSKSLNVEEIKNAFSGENILLNSGMRALEAEVPSLRANKILIWSLLDVFKQHTETIYIDTCCHYNELGNRVLAEAIAAKISSVSFMIGRK